MLIAKVQGPASLQPVPAPTKEEAQSAFAAAHAAVSVVDAPAADALWHAFSGVAAQIERAHFERKAMAAYISQLKVLAPWWT